MRSERLNTMVLVGVLLAVLGLAAGPAGAEMAATLAWEDGVQQARRWQHEGDMAWALRQWDAAYRSYAMVAEVYPGSPHARYAERRLAKLRARMLRPALSPAEETRFSQIGELLDWLIWP